MDKDYVAELLKTMSPSVVAKRLGTTTGEIRLYMAKHGLTYRRTRRAACNSHIKRLIAYFTNYDDATPREAAKAIGCNTGLASTVRTVMLEIKKPG